MSRKLLTAVAAAFCVAGSAHAQTILTAETAAPGTTPGISIISLSEAAAQEGITLGPEHFEIIGFLRDFHEGHRVSADFRFVLKYLSERDNVNKSGAKDIFFGLFPGGHLFF